MPERERFPLKIAKPLEGELPASTEDFRKKLGDLAHDSGIKTFARSLTRTEQDAEDLIQDAAVNAWRARETFDPSKASMRVWFTRIIRNRNVDRLRSRASHHASQHDSIHDTFDISNPADDDPSHALDYARVRAEIDHLPKEQKEVVMLCSIEGMSHADAAGMLGIPVGTVKSRLRLARDHLKSKFPGYFSDDDED